MKDTHFLYIVAALAIIGISATFISYATGTLPTYTPQRVGTATSVNDNSTNAKKGCGCCKEDLVKFREFMEARKRRKAAAHPQASEQNTTVLK